jgi:hypothetical protein
MIYLSPFIEETKIRSDIRIGINICKFNQFIVKSRFFDVTYNYRFFMLVEKELALVFK